MNKTVTFKIWRTDENGGGKLVDYTTEITEGPGGARCRPQNPGDAGERPCLPLELQGRQMRLLLRRSQRHAQAHVHDAHGHIEHRQAHHHRADAGVSFDPRFGDRCFVELSRQTKIKKFNPRPPDAADGTWRMQQEDVDRVQEFRKCIECFLCQDVCHVLRDHHKHDEFIGPRFLVYTAALEMHPLDTEDRLPELKQSQGIGFCNHHQMLHESLSRTHHHHRQRDHPVEGTRRG